MAKIPLGPPPGFSVTSADPGVKVDIAKPQHFKRDRDENLPSSTTTLEEKNIPIIRKHSSQPELRKLKLSRPSFDPTEGIDFENFASKKEAFLMGYLNALYHRLDGVKKVK